MIEWKIMLGVGDPI